MTSGNTTPTTDWLAPYADQPVVGTFTVPGSKSLTNRYLVLAALADDDSLLRAPLRSRDTLLMADALRAMGVKIDDVEGDSASDPDWHIQPGLLHGPATIDCGLAGTVMRFLPPVAALADGKITFDGDAHARLRPMEPVLQALIDLGVKIKDDDRRALPFTIKGKGFVKGGKVKIDASNSSQFVSALLLAGARFDGGLTIVHKGKNLPSLPHINMTIEVLQDAGVFVEATNEGDKYVWHVEPNDIRSLDVQVEPDLTNAAPFLAAAAVTRGDVFMPNWPMFTTQAGDQIRDVLDRMGAKVTLDRKGLHVKGPKKLQGIDIDLSNAAELTPTVVALAALAKGPSRIRGVAHIRGHETDRLAALTKEFSALGTDIAETSDGLVIAPRPMSPSVFHTYDDHRMAMAAAIVGLAVPGVTIENVGTTAKTLPDFALRWSDLVNGNN